MMQILTKLQELESKEDWHWSTRQLFKEWRTQLEQLEIDKNFLEMPQVVKIAEVLRSMIDNSNSELSNNREIGKVGRSQFFATRDVAEAMLEIFSDNNYKSAAAIIERDIDAELKK